MGIPDSFIFKKSERHHCVFVHSHCDKVFGASKVDCYIAGFPCTPYSTLGEMMGLADPNARQMLACVKRMKVNRPKVS